MAPNVVYFNSEDKILIIDDVAGDNGCLFEKVFKDRVNEKISTSLAEIAAKLASKTYNKFEYLRSEDLDLKIRKVKLYYAYEELFNNAKDSHNQDKTNKLVEKFKKQSINCNRSLSHGDYHDRNIIIKENDEVSLIDFEEAVIHDPVLDIANLIAHYMLRMIKYEERSEYFRKLTLLLFDTFFEKLDIPEDKKDLEYRLNNYIAGWLKIRVDGINKYDWLLEPTTSENVRKSAWEFFINSSSPTDDLIKNI